MKLMRWPSPQPLAGKERDRTIGQQFCLPRLDLSLERSESLRAWVACQRVLPSQLAYAIQASSDRPVRLLERDPNTRPPPRSVARTHT